MFFQIGRYPEGSAKDRSVLRVRPGDSMPVPVFEAADQGRAVRHETFQVVVIVYHLGDTPTSGHYLTLIGRPCQDTWSYFVCDDNKPPRKVRSKDLRDVDHNAYLSGAMRRL